MDKERCRMFPAGWSSRISGVWLTVRQPVLANSAETVTAFWAYFGVLAIVIFPKPRFFYNSSNANALYGNSMLISQEVCLICVISFEDLIVPRCGISDAFANHRQPRKRWRPNNEASRSVLFFNEDNYKHDNGWEVVTHQARIIRGQQSMRNAWPWQVAVHWW